MDSLGGDGWTYMVAILWAVFELLSLDLVYVCFFVVQDGYQRSQR